MNQKRQFLKVLVWGIGILLLTREAFTSSISILYISFEKAAEKSGRIVLGKITAIPAVNIEGDEFHSIDVTVEKVLKGKPGDAGEKIRIFNPGAWFQHSHAAAIKGDVISYSDPHYQSKVKSEDVKPGAKLIFFLKDEAMPEGFPKGSAFLFCDGSWESIDREKDFGQTITLKVGDSIAVPGGLKIILAGHSHKRPMVGGPQKETSEVRVALGSKSELLYLGHITESDSSGTVSTETWEKRIWEGYEFELTGMTYDKESVLRTRKIRKP